MQPLPGICDRLASRLQRKEFPFLRPGGSTRAAGCMFSRRQMLQLLALSVVGGCHSSRDYTEEDRQRLQRQQREESLRSGSGPFGPLVFEGYQDLQRLPYFRLDEAGLLRIAIDLPPTFDFHAHLGWSYFLAPPVDLLARTPVVHYLMDCDAERPPCELDLDVYVNSNFTPAMHRKLSWETITSLLWGSRAAQTHTIPNLLAEMDRTGVAKAALLPIAVRLLGSRDATREVLQALRRSATPERLVPFASVHPHDPKAASDLADYARHGVRGVKLHPEMQRFYPDDERAMPVYEACARLGLPVIFHAGRSGIEPEFLRPYALLRRYERPIREFPQVQFVLGHAGARDVEEAVQLARKYDNVWLELSSQGVTSIYNLHKTLGSERLLYGSDWPFYPQAVALAKILLVTEHTLEARIRILGGNAERLLAMGATRSPAAANPATAPPLA